MQVRSCRLCFQAHACESNSLIFAGSYVKAGTELTTFLAAAPNYVPKTTKIVSAALNASLLIDGGHRAPSAGGDPAANDHNPKIPGGINMNLLSPQQRCDSSQRLSHARLRSGELGCCEVSHAAVHLRKLTRAGSWPHMSIGR